jgi:SAM-dependent methyltransferase
VLLQLALGEAIMALHYNSQFYENQSQGSRKSAGVVIPLVNKLVRPRSVLDVGCGVGTWLAEWVAQGVTDVVGLDGEYVDKTALHIETAKFVPTDLTKRFSLSRKFDLVECLEVAEHLDESCAAQFIECLTSHGDIVLFSAAIPGQGGTNHVNEQWPSYWAEKFFRAGFKSYDIIRSVIWADPNVELCYRQNILIFSKERVFDSVTTPIDFVHPEEWQDRIGYQPYLKEVLRSLPSALRRTLRNRLGRDGFR